MLVVPDILSFTIEISAVLVGIVVIWLLFGNAISIALVYVAIGVCRAMKRERNGDHHKHAGALAVPGAPGRYAAH